MHELEEWYLTMFHKPMFQLAQGILIGIAIAFGIWLLCKGIDKDMQEEEDEDGQGQDT